MRQIKFITTLLSFLLLIPTAFAQSPVGEWTTFDDGTGEKKAVIQIEMKDNVLSGRIIKTYSREGDIKTCSKCPEDLKDKPILGLRVMWGLQHRANDVWDGGEIIDPRNGKIYHAKITVDGNKLHVRGYIGISALGRTQTWVR